MARTDDAPGMIGYVKKQNDEGKKRNGSNDDLKFTTTTKGSANTRAARVEGGPTTRARSNGRMPQEAHQNVPRTFQDTDTSFGKTTTTAGSTSRARSAGDNKRRVAETAPPHTIPDEAFNEEEFESYEEDESGESDGEQESPERPPQGTKTKQSTRGHGGAPHPQAMPDGRNLGPISGDTYPETTSGRPSTTNADDHRENQTAVYSQANAGQSVKMPERGAGTRLTFPPQNVQVPSHAPNRQPAASGPQQSVQNVMKDLNSGFAFASNKPQATRTQAAQPPPYQNLSIKPMAASTVHRGPSTSGNQLPAKEFRTEQPNQHIKPESQYTAPVPFQPGLQKPQSESARHYPAPELQVSQAPPQPLQQQYRQHHERTPPAQVVEAPESEMMSEVGDQNNGNYEPRETSFEPQHAQQEINESAPLDYDPPELYKKTFNELKAASFDTDPNSVAPNVLSTLQPDDLLSKKLEALLSKDVRAKQDYFASLGIEEWEEAGDWFLESFAKLTDRFKIARREKRKLAREFESDVEARHEAVSKKQKLTAAAMNEMKESGGKVLQGTPKKSVNPVK